MPDGKDGGGGRFPRRGASFSALDGKGRCLADVGGWCPVEKYPADALRGRFQKPRLARDSKLCFCFTTRPAEQFEFVIVAFGEIFGVAENGFDGIDQIGEFLIFVGSSGFGGGAGC